jgi:peptide/nickel transport system permease protein
VSNDPVAAVESPIEPSFAGRPRTASRRRLSRRSVYAGFLILLLTFWVLVALFAPFLAPKDPIRPNLFDSALPPAWEDGGKGAYLFGTDHLGRDVLSRVIYGARVSLIVAISTIVIGGGVGTILGMIAGYFGRVVDAVIMRLTDTALAFPSILLAIMLATVFGPSYFNVLLVVSMIIWPRFARQARGETLALRELLFVKYAGAVGVPWRRILLRHIFPNVLPSILVLASWQVAFVIILEASLSFLGVGIPPPNPSWGVMVSDGRSYLSTEWWIAVFPAGAIVLTVVAINMFGDWLRDALDPKRKGL